MKQQQKLQQGQGMTEYIIILSLVAVAAITVFSAFGGANRAQVAAVANEIAGNHQGAKNSIQLAQNYAKYASDTASYSRDMGNYNSSPDWSNYSGGGSSGTGGSGTGGSGTGSSGTGSSGTGSSGTGSSGSGGSGTGGSGTGSSGSGSSGGGTEVASCNVESTDGYSVVAKPTKIDGTEGEICKTQTKVYKKYKQIKYSVDLLGGEYDPKKAGYSTVTTDGKNGLKVAIADGVDIEIIMLTATKIHEESHRQDVLKNAVNIAILKNAKANLIVRMDTKAKYISEVNASVDELKYLNNQLALAKKAKRKNAVIIIEGYIKSAQDYYNKYEAKIK